MCEPIAKKAVRAITNSKFNAHTEPLLKLLNLLNIKDTYILSILTFYYKYIHNILPPYFQTYEIKLTSEMHNYNTRSKNSKNISYFQLIINMQNIVLDISFHRY